MMPLDNTYFLDSDSYAAELKLIDDTLHLISTPSRWCKKTYRKSRWFHYAYCLEGALGTSAMGDHHWCNLQDHAPARNVWYVLSTLTADGVSRFNDRESTTHADVIALLINARQIFLEREAREKLTAISAN